MNEVYSEGEPVRMLRLQHPEQARALFAGWEETMIFSCLEGRMGAVYADCEEHPLRAAAILGDFCFLAGQPSAQWLLRLPHPYPPILVPQTEEWSAAIEQCFPGLVTPSVRYAIRKEQPQFDKNLLTRAMQALPPGYTVCPIEEVLYRICLREAWSRDLVSLYRNVEDYLQNGLGFAALYDGIPVSGASSYSRYSGGIEIEIDTRADHRRRGLAFACGAALISECMNRGRYPSWDAANLASASLAEKLGYRRGNEYRAYLFHAEQKRS